MTLSIGDHLVKLDKNGNPIKYEREAWIEFEVVELGVATWENERADWFQTVKLRKVR